MATTPKETLLLPWPPSVNGYWAVWVNPKTKIGRLILSRKGRLYQKAVMAACGNRTPIRGRLSLKIDLYAPDKRDRDIDNYLKSLLDGMKHGGVYGDDSQIDHIDLLRCSVAPPGRVVVELEVMSEEPDLFKGVA